ncbi:MAG TPA: CmcI family methyltransferase [Thermoanaerobaculia bacterium]|nr:CmcI family methyltransferase [Thermoanaerobaculia bacterium]
MDFERGVVTLDGADGDATYNIGSAEGFEAVSKAWLRSGWDAKYVYSFTWMGRPVIQLPDDMIRIQEVIYAIQPDVIIETGIAHGGSLIFYASLCKAMEKGRVIGIDIEIRPHNRKAIDEHPLRSYLTLIEGSSVDAAIVDEVRSHVKPGETVLILLDSNHTKAHVFAELEVYAPMVTPGSYIVATDGIMHWLSNAPRTQDDWSWNNPRDAAREFVAKNPEFVIEEPPFAFNEGVVRERVTYWPEAFLKRVK